MSAATFEHRHAPIEIAVSVCAWCSAVKLGFFWVKRPSWMPFTFDVRRGPVRAFGSHGVCPACSERIVRESKAERRRAGL